MREVDRLRSLQMGVARHDKIDMFRGEIEQRSLERARLADDPLDLFLCVKSKIDSDLIVPAASGVELCAALTDARHQLSLDIHVEILEAGIPLKFTVFNLLLDFAQTVFDLRAFLWGQDSPGGQRTSVCDRPGDVVTVEALVVRNRFAESSCRIRHPALKPAFTHSLGYFLARVRF